MKSTALIAAVLSGFFAMELMAAEVKTSVDAENLAKKKQTNLGLYMTARDAHDAITTDPEIFYLDVRDPIEIAFVGHAQGLDAIVPIRIATHEFHAKSGRYKLAPNDAFVEQVMTALSRQGKDKDAVMILACRSGVRSAAAVNVLAKAGFTNVYNQIEGFEGDWNSQTQSRDKNGWRNSGLPWQMNISEEVAWQPQP